MVPAPVNVPKVLFYHSKQIQEVFCDAGYKRVKFSALFKRPAAESGARMRHKDRNSIFCVYGYAPPRVGDVEWVLSLMNMADCL